MEKPLTPADVRRRAAAALVTMTALFDKANVSPAAFWLWENKRVTPRPLTLAKLRNALVELEKDRAS